MKVIVLIGRDGHDTDFLGVFSSQESIDKYFENNPELEDSYLYGFSTIETEVIK